MLSKNIFVYGSGPIQFSIRTVLEDPQIKEYFMDSNPIKRRHSFPTFRVQVTKLAKLLEI